MRKSGILLSISSLPSEHGIGTLGKSAYDFIDFLSSAGQYYWQVLPLSPVSFGNSPYQSFSAFAFNPYYIDLDFLISDALLTKDEACAYDNESHEIDYSSLFVNRQRILKSAAKRFDKSDVGFKEFCKENDFWLKDYAVFMAYKEKHNMAPLCDFTKEIKRRDKEALSLFEEENEEDIACHKIMQYLFYRQWIKLRRYANDNGVHIIGDIPIYVSQDSCDVWKKPELFSVDESLKPVLSAGCPPDDFSKDGQLWGNPVYNFPFHEETDYEWWLCRFRQAQTLFDVTRIDHFRGFYSYYAIPFGEKTAVNGHWVNANGEKLMKRVGEEFPKIKIIAEDLGFITPQIRARMEKSGFPGMKIIQFGFDSDSKNEHLPHNFTKNTVAYTGTHDNHTIKGWVTGADKKSVEFALDYFGVGSVTGLSEAMIRGTLSSVSDTAIIPFQDYLKQGDESRMNIPSTIGNNWTYRIKSDDMNEKLAQKIRRLTALYGRL